MNPVAISPRMLPGVRVGDAWLSLEPTSHADHMGKPVWSWFIDGPGIDASGDDLAGWGDAGEMLGALCSFLSACAEARSYQTRTGRVSENADLFSDAVGEWAEQNSEELSMVSLELEEGEA